MKKMIILLASYLSVQCYALNTTVTGQFANATKVDLASIAECSAYTTKTCTYKGNEFYFTDSAEKALIKKENQCHTAGAICNYSIEYKKSGINNMITKVNKANYVGVGEQSD